MPAPGLAAGPGVRTVIGVHALAPGSPWCTTSAPRLHFPPEVQMANIELQQDEGHGWLWLVVVLAALALLMLWYVGREEERPETMPDPTVTTALGAAA